MAIEGLGDMAEPKHCPNCGWVIVPISAYEDLSHSHWTCPDCGELIDDESQEIPEDVRAAAEYVRDHSATFGEEGYDIETHECSWEESPDYEFEKAAKLVAAFVLRLAKKAD